MHFPFLTKPIVKAIVLTFYVATLASCSSSDDDNDNDNGYIKFYNASPDSSAIFMTVDEDVDNDEDDEYETTFSSVAYASAGSRIGLEAQDYHVELSWQDEDSSQRSDLEIAFETQLEILADHTHWIVMNGSIQSPSVNIYSIAERDDEEVSDDQDKDLFNLRVVNLHRQHTNIDLYISLSDETYEEATLLSTLVLESISDNVKFAQDQYKFYITDAGATDILYESSEINYLYNAQYVAVIRQNSGIGGSPFVIDVITNTGLAHYDDEDSLAQISVYNGLNQNAYMPDYQTALNINIQGVTEVPTIEALGFSQLSQSFPVSSGDYNLDLSNPLNDHPLLQNRLLSLPQNTNKTVFLFWDEEAIDKDGDGNVDENDDGIIDEVRPIVRTLVVDNSDLDRLYDKQVTMINLVKTDLFSSVTVYFVKSDEIISTADSYRNLPEGVSTSVILRNNTYHVFAVASIDNNDIIIDEFTLTLDEASKDQFLLLEYSDNNSSGFALKLVDQTPE